MGGRYEKEAHILKLNFIFTLQMKFKKRVKHNSKISTF